MLDLRKLKALREVALRESFSEAAERLGYTQSAISQQISQLERQVGTLLVERRGRGIKLTPAGRTLVECANVILRQLVEAEAELEAITGIRQGALRLAAFGEAAVTWMPSAIRRFQGRHPLVRVSMTIADTRAAAALVDSGEAEIAVITLSENLPLTGGVAVVELFEDPLQVVLPEDHRLVGRAAVGLAELAEDSWILPSASSADGEAFSAFCHASGVRPRVVARVDDCLAAHGFVAAGLGVAFLPSTVARLPLRDDVVVRSLRPPEPVRRVAAVVRSGIERSPSVTTMLAELQHEAARCHATRDLHVPVELLPPGDPTAMAG